MPNLAPSLKPKTSLPVAIAIILGIVIFIREGAVMVCDALGYASAANIVGMITLFVILMIWRFSLGIPEWVTTASNTLLMDSGFAFLPVSAGAGLLIFGLGDELWGIMITMIISTLLPLWVLAKLANAWLSNKNDQSQAIDANSVINNSNDTVSDLLSNRDKD